jgi:hypothetical protein
MVTWREFEQSPSVWDASLLQARDCNIFQSYAWGEYKKNFGWTPLRFVATNKEQISVGMVQILLKKLPLGFGIGWSPGGPVFGFAGSIRWGNELPILLKHLHSLYPGILFRFHSHEEYHCLSAYDFRRACSRPFYKINSGFTILNSLKFVDYQNKMTAKHRYYLKKAILGNVEWMHGATDKNISDFIEVHRQMVSAKAIPSISTSYEDLIMLRDTLGVGGMTVLTGHISGRPVTSCISYDFGRRSIYMMAATNDAGRKINAAYAMIPQLFMHLKEKGIEVFDFGGIDPGNPNLEGVDHFKKGFGGKIVEYLGEWESVNSETLRIFLNIGIKRLGR